MNKTINPIKFYAVNGRWIEHNDVIKCMKSIESNSVDLIVADPPYFQVYGDFDFKTFKNENEYLI